MNTTILELTAYYISFGGTVLQFSRVWDKAIKFIYKNHGPVLVPTEVNEL